ncbi:MAG TPA: hypothetical protein VJ836_01425 [Candidatus Saccharimonadales bacterium]|nr:hypothetical protein [Candidatus Saccharimonadales bacterium]
MKHGVHEGADHKMDTGAIMLDGLAYSISGALASTPLAHLISGDMAAK